jgi:hypothetical protein
MPQMTGIEAKKIESKRRHQTYLDNHDDTALIRLNIWKLPSSWCNRLCQKPIDEVELLARVNSYQLVTVYRFNSKR